MILGERAGFWLLTGDEAESPENDLPASQVEGMFRFPW